MVRYEDQCVGCPPEMGCMGSACPYMNVPVWICDKCGDEDVELFEFDNKELCIDCIQKILPRVNRRL